MGYIHICITLYGIYTCTYYIIWDIFIYVLHHMGYIHICVTLYGMYTLHQIYTLYCIYTLYWMYYNVSYGAKGLICMVFTLHIFPRVCLACSSHSFVFCICVLDTYEFLFFTFACLSYLCVLHLYSHVCFTLKYFFTILSIFSPFYIFHISLFSTSL
jgi:hypothetical protein